MSTVLLPDADADVGDWINEVGGSLLFPSLADASDATYARSPNLPSDASFRVSIGNSGATVVEPVVIRYRLKAELSLDRHINAIVRLFEGATLAAEWGHLDLDTVFEEFEQTLTGEQFAAIGDFDDLFLEFEVAVAPPPSPLGTLDFSDPAASGLLALLEDI